MASLLQALKKNQGLVQTSAEEAQKLTGGVPVTSPMMSATLGQNPDSAKMTGTPAQKTNALRTAIQGQDDLATRLRTEGPRTLATAQEQAQKTQAGQAQGLKGLQQAVQQSVQTALTQASAQNVQLQAAQGLSTDKAKLATALTDADKGNDQAALVEYANKTGALPSQEEIGQLVGGVQGQAGIAGATVAGGIQNQIFSKDLNPSVQQTASQLLGKDVSGLTVQQLIDEIEAEIETEQSSVQSLQEQLNNPMLGAAERAEVRKQLRDKGAVGIRAAETVADQLADDIVNANTVQFNGQDLKTEDLLSDDFVAGTVANYLMDPNSPTSKELEKNEPAMVKFINQYRAVLEPAIQSLGSEIPRLAEIKAKNQALSKVSLPSGEQLSIPKEMMQVLVPGFDGFTGQQMNAGQSGLLTYLNNPSISGDTRKQVLEKTASLPTELLSQMKNYTDKDIAYFFQQEGPRTGALIEQYNQVKNIQSTDDAARIMGFSDAADMQRVVSDASRRARMGLGTVDLGKLGIIADPRGQIDWAQTSALLKQSTPKSLGEMYDRAVIPVAQKVGEVKSVAAKPISGIQQTLEKAFENDSTVSLSELKSMGLLEKLSGVDEFSSLQKDPVYRQFSGEAQNTLRTLAEQERARKSAAEKTLMSAIGVGALPKVVSKTIKSDAEIAAPKVRTAMEDIAYATNRFAGVSSPEKLSYKNINPSNVKDIEGLIAGFTRDIETAKDPFAKKEYEKARDAIQKQYQLYHSMQALNKGTKSLRNVPGLF